MRVDRTDGSHAESLRESSLYSISQLSELPHQVPSSSFSGKSGMGGDDQFE